MKIETKFVEATEVGTRFEVFVNHKRQGIIIGVPETDPQYRGKFSSWTVEGDAFKNSYNDSNSAVEALCAKNGRKLKFKNKKK